MKKPVKKKTERTRVDAQLKEFERRGLRPRIGAYLVVNQDHRGVVDVETQHGRSSSPWLP